jgi:hypothetical protein
MDRSYQEIKLACLRKRYKFFTGNFDVNCIWERTSDELTNHFTDWFHLAYMEGSAEKVITVRATTKPGLRGSALNPVTVEGITGTAIIIPGQYVKAFKFIDSYVGWTKYPYFQQVGPLDYWRDGNKDLQVDRVQEQDDKLYGTNWHRMTRPGIADGEVDNWSLGCMGWPETEMVKILPIIRKSVEMYGDVFSGTLLESKDFF